jgi:hypothetical protein
MAHCKYGRRTKLGNHVWLAFTLVTQPASRWLAASQLSHDATHCVPLWRVQPGVTLWP